MIQPTMREVNVILLAEDEDDDVVFMKHALRQARIGSDVQWVQDGEQTIAVSGLWLRGVCQSEEISAAGSDLSRCGGC